MDAAWKLCRPNYEPRSPQVLFRNNGVIDGYSHDNEKSWAIEKGCLVLFNKTGHPSARSGIIDPTVANETITLMRVDKPAEIAHILVRRKDKVFTLQVKTPADLLREIEAHPALLNKFRFDNSTSPPDLIELEIIPVNKTTIEVLASKGIIIAGDFGLGNIVVLDRMMITQGLTIRFGGRHYNSLVIGRDCNVRGTITFESDENIFICSGTYPGRITALTVTFRYGTSALVLGKDSSTGGVNIWIEGPERMVVIGDDFMGSWNIWLRTADSHAIVDLASGVITNHPKNIAIGAHVWLGQDVLVMPGVKIGSGAIIGARSVVTKSINDKTVAVGSPAKAVKTNVSWTRTATPSDSEIEFLRNRLNGLP